MHMRVTRGRFDPADYEKLVRVVEQTVPLAKGLVGCQSFQVALDRAGGRLVAVSTWDAPEQAEAMAQLRTPAEAVGVQYEAPEIYEVVGQL